MRWDEYFRKRSILFSLLLQNKKRSENLFGLQTAFIIYTLSGRRFGVSVIGGKGLRFISAAVWVVQFENCSADYTRIADGAIIRVGGIRVVGATEDKRRHRAAAFAETFDF